MNNPVRVIEKGDQIWFVAKDICDILELANPTEALKSLDEKNSVRISDGTSKLGGNPNMNNISEPGFYRLAFRSSKPNTKKFI